MMKNKGYRICILGNAGSGKSTIANELGKELNIPVFHLDRYLLNEKFEKIPHTEFVKAHDELIKGENWVIDGNYRNVLKERARLATLVVYLNVSRFEALKRVYGRFKKGGRNLNQIPDGANPAKLDWSFIKMILTYSRRSRLKEFKKLCSEVKSPLLIINKSSTSETVAKIKSQLSAISKTD